MTRNMPIWEKIFRCPHCSTIVSDSFGLYVSSECTLKCPVCKLNGVWDKTENERIRDAKS